VPVFGRQQQAGGLPPTGPGAGTARRTSGRQTATKPRSGAGGRRSGEWKHSFLSQMHTTGSNFKASGETVQSLVSPEPVVGMAAAGAPGSSAAAAAAQAAAAAGAAEQQPTPPTAPAAAHKAAAASPALQEQHAVLGALTPADAPVAAAPSTAKRATGRQPNMSGLREIMGLTISPDSQRRMLSGKRNTR
jgi:hypothetical protein